MSGGEQLQKKRGARADRVTDAHLTATPVALADRPDAAALVDRMLLSDYPVHVTIRLPLSMDEAPRVVPPHRGSHQSNDVGTLVTIGGTSPDQFAAYLFGLATPVQILEPDSVREAVRQRVGELLGASD